MNSLEAQLRRDWIRGAAQVYYGRCDTCGKVRVDQVNAILVCRQPRRRGRECFDCYAARVDYGQTGTPPERTGTHARSGVR